MQNTIIYLIGHAGTGKYTIAKELCKHIDAKLVDNHYINNPVFNLLEMTDEELPEKVWDLTDRVKSIIFETIAELSPKHYNFIMTNVLYEDEARDHKNFYKLMELAEDRSSTFVPVLLDISEEALVKRRTDKGRKERLKDTSAENARREYAEKEILAFEHDNRFDIDVSDIPPDETAAKILEHIQKNC